MLISAALYLYWSETLRKLAAAFKECRKWASCGFPSPAPSQLVPPYPAFCFVLSTGCRLSGRSDETNWALIVFSSHHLDFQDIDERVFVLMRSESVISECITGQPFECLWEWESLKSLCACTCVSCWWLLLSILGGGSGCGDWMCVLFASPSVEVLWWMVTDGGCEVCEGGGGGWRGEAVGWGRVLGGDGETGRTSVCVCVCSCMW